MNLQSEQIKDSCCPREEIAAYVDGELSSSEEFDLDLHLSNCKICSDELNSQKKVSTTLEILLEDKAEDIKLPENFTKVITAKAESNVSGLRHPKERLSAVFISASLVLLVVVGLRTQFETLSFAVRKFTHQFLAVVGFLWHMIIDVALVFAVILRSLSQHFVYGSALTLILILTVFALTALILSKMILRFERS
ncbi:MAG: zf-HC2 domain-containing protein [Acidobacteriota bacterium]|jgi:predicted anti-sigma-YlaC factor YlaD|nr:zf-HC2 domain-containing protein [Acidobacteriota bacterium]